ncbi:hypothetical protein GQ53DRAFT_733954 [Thozetella sp. PMI_491]|nr:hypothetical protein GQ53DRAFT_733954 [Thozetella sp. PMI_491]
MDVFRVRLNCIDHCQAAPTRYDPKLGQDIVKPGRLSKPPKVPVIRVFGSTETGQKVCAHIHGAFPYLFVDYTGSLEPDDVNAYISRLHLSIDHALAVSYRQDVRRDQPRFVARITLVKGIPFYGFHVGYRLYLKIYLFNPVAMTRLADLLQQGLIMNRKFQPYEAHIQYLLQFMADFNLYGCTYIDAATATFRAPVPKYDEDADLPHAWHSQSIPSKNITDDYALPRVSHCAIEVDISVQDILNRKGVRERRLHHDFVERAQPLPQSMKLVPSMAGLWKDETKRRKRKMRDLPPGSSPFPPEVLISMSADPRDSQPQGWIHEDEFMAGVRQLVVQEEMSSAGEDISFESWVQPAALEDGVQTVMQSVEDMFPESFTPALDEAARLQAGQNSHSSIEVDEGGIRSFREGAKEGQEEYFFSDESDEEELIRNADILEQAANDMAAYAEPVHGLQALTTSGIQNRYEGLCLSAFGSGAPPQMPLHEALVAAAESEGLYSMAPSTMLAGVSSRGDALAQKRSVSSLGDALAGLDNPSKRQRSASAKHSVKFETAGQAGLRLTPPSAQKPRLEDQTRPPPSSQLRKGVAGKDQSRKPRDGNRPLNFAVVKDPNDASTRLRLSQLSGSQQAEEGKGKQVAFDEAAVAGAGSSGEPSSSQSVPLSSPTPQTQSQSQASSFSRPARPRTMFVLANPPPSAEEVCATMREYGVPDAIYQDAFYSKEKDVPARTREYAGREFRLEGNSLPFLPTFDPTGQSPATRGLKAPSAPDKVKMKLEYEKKQKECTLRSWEIARPPPSFDEVENWWLAKQEVAIRKRTGDAPNLPPTQKPWLSQIDAATPRNKHSFKYSQKAKSTSVEHEAQYMSTMSLEVHVNTRGKLVPNPEEDEVKCVFWCLKSDEDFGRSQSSTTGGGMQQGIVVFSEDGGVLGKQVRRQLPSVEVLEESSELDLFVRMVEVVRTHDPDVLTGYEVHGSSWGFLIERARLKYDYNLCDEFSRVKSQSHGRIGKEADRWGFNTTSTIRVTGRHMINVWRAMRGELNLLQYTMENVAWHLLHRRIPHYSWRTLTAWYTDGRQSDFAKLLRYYMTRAKLDIDILEANELIPRTSEQARLLGVDFFSVFSRGSQFKVESIMIRIAKPENFILVSPSRKQVGGQNALECLPLVMEPQSAFYSSPVLVLDFQSLYPSVMIAYNYCYSTFLGRMVNWRGMNKMGFTEYKRQQGLLRLLQDYINIAPNGMMFVKPQIRKSLLAKMLTEILETRVMVKSGMKQDKDDRALQQLLNNRQLALKLLANVTYGYTSASFSGRMPCSEIADSIVQTGRETLERAIAYIHSVERWGAEVVYGDTDSLFIHLPGRTREQAFDIGAEIAKEVTDMNPRPVKLKFEKVYHPCVLLAKKRYVGYMYESRTQTQPEFDAKGIETVRRDGTPAEQKIEEKALRLLFETADLSQIKAYFQAQCSKIMRGHVSIQDFCFAKEVRLGSYSDRAPPPPGAMISTKRMLEDARAEPQYGERVPYVVISGAPGARLIDRSVAPEDLLHSTHLTLDAEYYISKNIIPPLERIFNLVGANVRGWYDEMPKVQRIHRVDVASALGRSRRTLEAYMRSANCVVCGVKMKQAGTGTGDGMCRRCRRGRAPSMLQLHARISREEKKLADVVKVCQSCSGLGPLEEVQCDSKDCPVFYTRVKQAAKLKTEKAIVMPALRRLEDLGWDW